MAVTVRDANDNVWREDSGLLTDKTHFQLDSSGLGILAAARNFTTHWES